MSWFSDLFWGGTSTYADPFPPIIDTISDWGFSLLPMGIPQGSRGGGHVAGLTGKVGPDVPIDFGIPELPVEVPELEGSHGVLYSILPGPGGNGRSYVPPPIVRVDPETGVEVEEHPEGDFPVGSIFAPGEAWGGGWVDDYDYPVDLDTYPEEEEVAHDWMHLGRQVLGSWAGVQQAGQGFNEMGPAFAASPTDIPSGAAALPPSAAPVLSNGEDCGNRRYVTLDRQTGKISCRRRRRRRLLTDRDLGDLAALKTITGNNDALKMAVIKAVR